MSVQSRIIPTLLGVIALSPLAVSLSVATAHAGDVAQSGGAIVTRTVNYDDLDLSKQQDASTLYTRLKMASQRVCSNGVPSLDLRVRAIEKSCAEAALTDAVRKVDHPAVAALHDASPTRIAQSERDSERT